MTTTLSFRPAAKLIPLVQLTLLAVLAPAATAQVLNPPAARLSDQAISADQAGYTKLQERIRALNARGVRVGDYHLSKAQCWLDVSLHEYTRNDRSAFPQEAMGQSAAIVAALESGSTPNPGDATPLVNGADRLRDDLWARFGAVKNSAGFACAAQKVACGEVELVHAGNEYKQQGWRHANPYVQMAEDYAAGADAAAAACPAPGVRTDGPVTVTTREQVVERLTLTADALFKFDKSELKDLLPAGRANIDHMMSRLNAAYSQVNKITLQGHTDRLGEAAYNQALSERRAATVRQYMIGKGFQGEIAASGLGETRQVAACDGVKPRAALVECLQPNRRVDIEISGVKR